MTYGTDINEKIYGLKKILDINSQFSWNDIRCIDKIDYYIDLNECMEEVSYLKILFMYELPDKSISKVLVKFNEINNLTINNIGGKYNQIMGFEIIDQFAFGWECEQRYVVRDYENGSIEFYCKSIEVLSA